MRSVILDPASAGLAGLLAQRRRSGLDRFGEVWEAPCTWFPHRPGSSPTSATNCPCFSTIRRAAGLFVTIGGFNPGDSEAVYRVADGGLPRQ